MTNNKPFDIFISYSHKDERLRDGLQKHLVSLEREGLIATWHDYKIIPGTEWESEIYLRLNKAQIILLLISADFISSTFCYDKEMKRAIKRHESKKAIVIPVILRPVDWSGTPFSKIQALPRNAKPITKWTNQDDAFLDVVNGIRSLIKKLHPVSIKQNKIQKTLEKSISNLPLTKSEGQWVLVISATIEEVDKPIAEAIVEHLRKLSKDAHLTLKQINRGSVRLVLEGSIKGLSKIIELIEKGELQEIKGFAISNMEITKLVNLSVYLEQKLRQSRPSDITKSDINDILLIASKLRHQKINIDTSLLKDIETLCYLLLSSFSEPNLKRDYFINLNRLITMLEKLRLE